MRKTFIAAGLLAVAAAGSVPAAAAAQVRCVNPQNNTTTGALVGAAGGAAVGSVLAGRGDRGKGAVLGALGGALLGGAVGNRQTRCPEGYYAYDENSRQYYDNNGAVYQPQGAYGAGYNQGPGYNQGGAPPPPAYGAGGGYNQGSGYNQGPGYGPGGGGDYWQSAPRGINERISFLRERIQRSADSGRIGRREARDSFTDLDDIQRQEIMMRRRGGGQLNPTDRAYLQDRLDRARMILRDQRTGRY